MLILILGLAGCHWLLPLGTRAEDIPRPLPERGLGDRPPAVPDGPTDGVRDEPTDGPNRFDLPGLGSGLEAPVYNCETQCAGCCIGNICYAAGPANCGFGGQTCTTCPPVTECQTVQCVQGKGCVVGQAVGPCGTAQVCCGGVCCDISLVCCKGKCADAC
jgi:hypothetical protein